jgi:hypothetical protein
MRDQRHREERDVLALEAWSARPKSLGLDWEGMSFDVLQREMETDGDGQYLGPNSQGRILGSPAQLRQRRELGERRARERHRGRFDKPSEESPEGLSPTGDKRERVASIVQLAAVRPLYPAYGFARADSRQLVAA